MAGEARDFVIDALTSRGASLFTPLDHSPDVDLVARGIGGQYVEVRFADATGPSVFSVRSRRQRPALFIEFAKYRSTMTDPQALRMQLALG